MSSEYVRLAGESSRRASIAAQNAVHKAAQITGVGFAKIKRIRKLPAEPVYNMEVEQHHNFAVNGGLIVHNCIDAARYSTEPLSSMKRLQTMSKTSLGL